MNVHELSDGIGIRHLLKNCVCIPAFTGSSQCSGESVVVFLCIPSFYPIYSDFTGSSQCAGKSSCFHIHSNFYWVFSVCRKI